MNTDTKDKLFNWLINDVLKARWIVSVPDQDANEAETNDFDRFGGELGLRIGGINLWYYKYSDPMVTVSRRWRQATKREFGDTIHSILFPKPYHYN